MKPMKEILSQWSELCEKLAGEEGHSTVSAAIKKLIAEYAPDAEAMKQIPMGRRVQFILKFAKLRERYSREWNPHPREWNSREWNMGRAPYIPVSTPTAFHEAIVVVNQNQRQNTTRDYPMTEEAIGVSPTADNGATRFKQ